MTEQKNEVQENNIWLTGAGVVVVGLIIGFLAGWFWQQNNSRIRIVDDAPEFLATSTPRSAGLPETVYQKIDTPAFVAVDDQRAGSLVFIKHTESAKPTWIAVREIIDGKIGNILGAEMVVGNTDDVPVSLLRATKAGEKYAVFLYQENGDGEFGFKTDYLIVNGNTPVSAMFVAE